MGMHERDWYQEHWKRQLLGTDQETAQRRPRRQGFRWSYLAVVAFGALCGVGLHMKLGGYRISLKGLIAWASQWA